jgi:hypothetical protein
MTSLFILLLNMIRSLIAYQEGCFSIVGQCGLPAAGNTTLCTEHLSQRQCRQCGRRLQEKLFKNPSKGRLCNACHHRRIYWRQSGRGISSVNHTFITEQIPISSSVPDPLVYIQSIKSTLTDSLRTALSIQGQIKWYPSSTISFTRTVGEDTARFDGHFAAPAKILLREDEIDAQLEESMQVLLERAGDFAENGSDYQIRNLESLKILTAAYNPVGGSSFIGLPKNLATKHCIINIKNMDERCFEWAILAQLYPCENGKKNQVSSYRNHLGKLNFSGIDFPVKLSAIPRFERQNKDISIGVQTADESKRIVPIYASEYRDRTHHVNLFYLTKIVRLDDSGAEEVKHHYCLVTDLSRLLSSATAHNKKCFPCLHCLHRFYSKFALDRHTPLCYSNPPCRIFFPSKNIKIRKDNNDDAEFGEHETIEELLQIDADERKDIEFIEAIAEGRCPANILCYTQQQYEHPVPFCVYADFESFIEDDVHAVSGFCTLLASDFIDNEHPYCYSGPDPLKRFFEHLMSIRDRVETILGMNLPMEPLTNEQQEFHAKATHCYTCNKPFTTSNYKVHHHCHPTAFYIAPTCNNCNLKLKPRKFSKAQQKGIQKSFGKEFFIPIFFHNLRGYDSHLIIKALDKYNVNGIKIIASTTEKFMSFSLGGFKFIDSLQFLNDSLSSLVNVLAKNGTEKFNHTRHCFPDLAHFNLVCQKGIYPYEYMTGLDKFTEECLPPQEAFFSKLCDEHISDEDYVHAHNVWTVFDMKSLQDYHDLYLKTDVLLLADVFENFRMLSLQNYGIDAAHFITTPGMTMCAALKYTKVHLELLTNIDMLNFFEGGIRGGVSCIMNRYAKANIPTLSDYDSSMPNKYIMYLDMNNLYGRAMIDPLPVSDFRFLTREEINKLNILMITDDAEIGYALEVDLHYPPFLHDKHNDYPLAPEHLNITADMLSPYSQHLLNKLCKKSLSVNKKLVPNLSDKKNYIVHYRNLKFYLKMGLQIQYIHRVIQFKQSPWLKPYIDFNTDKRALATTDFEKNLYKLCNNAVFGKMCEDLRKRINVRIVTRQIEAERCVAQPNFDSFKILNDDATMIKMKKHRSCGENPHTSGLPS